MRNLSSIVKRNLLPVAITLRNGAMLTGLKSAWLLRFLLLLSVWFRLPLLCLMRSQFQTLITFQVKAT